jgi:hypothetical protein
MRSVLAPLLLASCLVLPLRALAEGGGSDEARHAAEARLAALPEQDAAAAYRLALELEAQGLEDVAHRAYERAISIDPDHAAARRALGYERIDGRWLAGDDLWRAKGFVHHEGRWMSAQEFAAATRPQRDAAEQKDGEQRVLAWLGMIGSEKADRVAEGRRRMALEEKRFKLAPLAQALRCQPTSLRVYAAEELGRLADPLGVPALLKRTIDDPDATVRAAAADALREIGEPSTVHPLGRALESRYADVRVRAAEALARLEDEVGAAYVLYKWEKRSGDFPRVYFTSVRQIGYIQDFDVEVAQTSFIADPVVGTLQEGVVQAVKVLATEDTFTTVERVAYQNALEHLTGEHLGPKVGAWRRWWDDNEKRLLDQRALRHERR